MALPQPPGRVETTGIVSSNDSSLTIVILTLLSFLCALYFIDTGKGRYVPPHARSAGSTRGPDPQHNYDNRGGVGKPY